MGNNYWFNIYVRSPLHKAAFLSVLLLNLFSPPAKSQTTDSKEPLVSLQCNEEAMPSVLKKIEKSSSFKFIFTYDEVQNYKVTANIKDKPISEVIQQIISPYPLNFKINNSFVTIFSVKKDLSPHIHGNVLDIYGSYLPGVNISTNIKGVGGVSNANGQFDISIPSGKVVDSITFSFIGFKTTSIPFSNEELSIVMDDDALLISEIVITGYQTIAKERATGSFSKLSAERLAQRPIMDVTQQLDGNVAGLNYTNGEIQIRGTGTIYANKDPLYVVDGFPLSGKLSTINPQDIESITVLKDASAASIWGVRASNGVVVITTKKGDGNKKTSVNFSAYVEATEKVKFSDMELMNTSEYIDMELEYIDKGWRNYSNLISQGGTLSLVDYAQIGLQGLAPDGNVWSQGQYNNYIEHLRKNDALKQWEKHMLRNPFKTTYNLSVSGGSENNDFYSSIVFNDYKEGSIGNSGTRTRVNIQDHYKVNDKLSFKTGVTASLANANNNGIDPTVAIRQNYPYENLVDENGQTIQYYKAWNKWKSKEREAINGVFPYTSNYLDEQRASDNTTEEVNVRALFGLNYKFTHELEASSSFQYEHGYGHNDNYTSMNSPSQRALVNDLFVDGVYQIPVGTQYQYSNNNYMAWVFRNTLNWDKIWSIHKLNVFMGTEIKKNTTNSYSDTKYGYNKQTNTYVPINQKDFQAGIIKNWNGDRYTINAPFKIFDTDNREFSVFTNMGYELHNKYSASASFRIDQKNLFGSDPSFRYKPLWSAGLGWKISNENFMSSFTYVDRLRLRATLGVNGNATQQSPYPQAKNFVVTNGTKPYDYLSIELPGNDNLKWEETRVLNLGLDFDLFKNRFGGSVEYYSKNSTDLIGLRQLDITNGFESAYVNYASMTNKGVDLSINGTIINNNKLSWTSVLNFGYNNNKITKIGSQVQSSRTIVSSGKVAVGSPLGNMYSFNYAGLDNAGNILLKDKDGSIRNWKSDGVPDTEDIIYNGKTVAPFYGGFSTTVEYFNFDLTVNLSYKFGHVFRRSYGTGYSGSLGILPDKNWVNRWKKPGDELTTRVPKISYEGINPYNNKIESYYDSNDGDSYYSLSNDFIYKADFIRVKDVILGYSVPHQVLSKTFIKNLRFTAQITNPFLWVANDKGYDPEDPYSQGFSNMRSFLCGVKTTF